MKYADLHVHTHYSDGIYSPKEIVGIAKSRGLSVLALTDHNSIDGIDEAIKEGVRQGIRIIPATELRSKEGEILGYFINHKDKEFAKKIQKIQKRGENVFKNAVKKLKENNINIKITEVLDTKYKKKNVLIAHLIKYLKKRNYDIKKFKKILKGPSFEPLFSAEEVVKIIKDSGGVPVLAHPWYSPKLLNNKRIKGLIKLGLKGVEIDNGGRGEKRKLLLKKVKMLASKNNLIMTKGSDFHGSNGIMSNSHLLGSPHSSKSLVIKLEALKNE